MVIDIHNVSSTSARVSWPSSPGCVDTFYSVMYDPNWNSLLMGYKRKSFMHEARIPVTQTNVYLGNLVPQTTYFLCVTCQAANPAQEQCQAFSTPSDQSEARDRAGWELAMGIWMASSILLLVIAGFLLWGCLHTICPLSGRSGEASFPAAGADLSRPGVSGSGCLYTASGSEDDGKRGTAVQNPFQSNPSTGHIITQGHELRTLAKLCDSDPV